MYGVLVPELSDMSQYTYARPFAPGVVKMLAAIRGDQTVLLTDQEVPGSVDDPAMPPLPGNAPSIFDMCMEATRYRSWRNSRKYQVNKTAVTVFESPFVFGAALITTPEIFINGKIVPDYGQGMVLATPTTNTVLLYPVQEGCDTSDLILMMDAIQDLARRGEAPMSPNMYWYRNGNLQSLTIENEGQLGLNVPLDMPVIRDANGVPTTTNTRYRGPSRG